VVTLDPGNSGDVRIPAEGIICATLLAEPCELEPRQRFLSRGRGGVDTNGELVDRKRLFVFGRRCVVLKERYGERRLG